MRGAQRIIFTATNARGDEERFVLVWTPLATAYAQRVENLQTWLRHNPVHNVTIEEA